jgi:hypothetical protein
VRYNPVLGMATREATDRRRDRWVALRVDEILENYTLRKIDRSDGLYALEALGVSFERACDLLEGKERR